ncbi:hypothetical protein A0256_10585 [Mucilaginibacter sp. PAMC 26640]|nr:hypothetical protein A0256_10585 [Mucilaginibacter sp. PAMC 26640]
MNTEFDRYLNTPFEFQNQLTALFSTDAAITIFDIGACEGEDSIKYSKLYPHSKIYAFEPLPGNFEKVKSNIEKYQAANVAPFCQALSDKIETTVFYISSGAPAGQENNPDWDFGNKSSSLLPPDKVSEEFEWLKFNQQVEIQTNTLFNFCKDKAINQIDFIHLDVQGAELLVLQGAGNFIKDIKCIWLEVENVSLYKNQPLKKDVERFMKQNEFTKIIDTVGSVSGDQLYVRNDLSQKLIKSKRPGLAQLKSLYRKLTPQKPQYQKQSYSQSGEDLIIDFIFTQIGIAQPTYLDIGAHHPYYLSNTALFHQKSCSGINVEPDRALFKAFQHDRKSDVNLNCGVGDKAGEMTLHIMDVPALNTFSVDEANRLVSEHGFKIVSKVTTPVYTVADIIAQYNNNIFPDLLSVDVEGFDEAIIKSIDFKKSAPIVICLETISYSDTGNGVKDTVLINYLTENGYMVYADTNINTIFVLQNKWQR